MLTKVGLALSLATKALAGLRHSHQTRRWQLLGLLISRRRKIILAVVCKLMVFIAKSGIPKPANASIPWHTVILFGLLPSHPRFLPAV
jgi:hypothetical protein